MVAEKIVARSGLGGPYQLLEGTIADYENQSGKIDFVWYGGSESDPACAWLVFPDDSSVKIKWPAPSELGFCQTVIDCIIADLAKGGGTDDKYLVPELAGPTWQVLSVIYGEDDTEVDFSDVTEDDLIALVGALNNHDDLPDGWLWSISSGVLVLSVPHDTGVTQISIAGGFEIDFTAPSVIGTPASQLAEPMAEALAGPMDTVIAQYEALLETYAGVLANTFGVGVGDTEAEIETEFTANAKIEVRWTDADGDPRVSYKDPVNGWYHPVYKEVFPIEFFSTISATTVSTTPAIAGVSGIPSDATHVFVSLSVSKSTGTSNGSVEASILTDGLTNLNTRFRVTSSNGDGRNRAAYKVKIKSDGTIGCYYNPIAADNPSAEFHITGWSR